MRRLYLISLHIHNLNEQNHFKETKEYKANLKIFKKDNLLFIIFVLSF